MIDECQQYIESDTEILNNVFNTICILEHFIK